MRKIALYLLLATLISLIPVYAFAEVQTDAGLDNFKEIKNYRDGQFSDVSEGQWYYESVKYAYEYGLVMGNGNGKFNVSGNITIAETIALASRLHSIYNGGNGDFNQTSIWYQVYVEYAEDNGIIKQGEYSNYNQVATRSQFVRILSNAFPDAAFSVINNINRIPDVNAFDSYYNDVLKLYRAGILTGSDEFGTFNPYSNIKRSEVSAIITRMVDKSLRKYVTLQIPTEPENDSPIDMIGKTFKTIREKYGTNYEYDDFCGMVEYVSEEESIGFYFDTYELESPKDSDCVYAIQMNNVNVEVIDGMTSSMTYDEILSIVGAVRLELYDDDFYGDYYSLECTYKGYSMHYRWDPLESYNSKSSFFWIAKY